MLIISLESWLLSLLTELPNGLPSAELFETNLLFGVTLPFYFPNDVTYGIGVANSIILHITLPCLTLHPLLLQTQKTTKMKIKLNSHENSNEKVQEQDKSWESGNCVGKTRTLELHLYFHASFTPYFFWDWGKLVDLSVFQFYHLWNGNNIIVST